MSRVTDWILSGKPAAIHAHLEFNEVIGMDTATWTNDQGVKFTFVHVLDDGTLFHLGKRCAEDSDSQLSCFGDTWLSWAGPPKQVYLDLATAYHSETGWKPCNLKIYNLRCQQLSRTGSLAGLKLMEKLSRECWV